MRCGDFATRQPAVPACRRIVKDNPLILNQKTTSSGSDGKTGRILPNGNLLSLFKDAFYSDALGNFSAKTAVHSGGIVVDAVHVDRGSGVEGQCPEQVITAIRRPLPYLRNMFILT
jgi:hypothetical protein